MDRNHSSYIARASVRANKIGSPLQTFTIAIYTAIHIPGRNVYVLKFRVSIIMIEKVCGELNVDYWNSEGM